jgi:N-methylhydantoinase B
MGIRRDIRIIGHEAELSTHADRQRFAPWGLQGGGPGATGRMVINLGRKTEWALPSGKNSNVRLKANDVLSIITPGGGGYGDPAERAPEMVLRDVVNGLVSPEEAERSYGVKVDPDAGTVRSRA